MEIMVTQYGERSKELNEWFTGLNKFQGLVDAIPRNSKGEFGDFSDLDAVMATIRDPLCQSGLSVSQWPHDVGEGYIRLETTIGHNSGQFKTGYKTLYINGSDDADQGGSVGYWSRICLMKALGIRSESLNKAAPDDDDGKKGRGVFDSSLLKGKSKQWYEQAAKALAAKDADRAALFVKIHDSVEAGRMTEDMLEDLRKRFPVGGEDADK